MDVNTVEWIAEEFNNIFAVASNFSKASYLILKKTKMF